MMMALTQPQNNFLIYMINSDGNLISGGQQQVPVQVQVPVQQQQQLNQLQH